MRSNCRRCRMRPKEWPLARGGKNSGDVQLRAKAMNLHGEWPGLPPQGRSRLLLPLLIIALGALLGAGLMLVLHGNDGAASGQQTGLNDQAVYNRVEPSVVDVTATLGYDGATAEGTGFVINAPGGLVLTNNHVIRDATQVSATLVGTGRTYPARIVGDDPADDIAVLKLVGATGLTAAPLGNSSQVTLGTPVLAIGNQAGQGGAPTIAPGIINSIGRTVEAGDSDSSFTETLRGMLQTSAQIAPGDSGGPLANAAGQVIGIDTAASSASGGAAVTGFAIPINNAIAIATKIAGGRASSVVNIGVPGFLGVLVADSPQPDPRRQLGQSARTRRGSAPGFGGCLASAEEAMPPNAVAPARSGALVDGVLCYTAAQTAGISAGDVVTSIGGRTVSSGDQLTKVLAGLRPGARVRVTWMAVRGGVHAASLRLDAAPAR